MPLRFYLIFITTLVACTELTAYRVVLDPGHGGRDILPVSAYGDKWDPLRGEYLDRFREGARCQGVWELEAMYDIAQRAKVLIELTHTREGQAQFKQILARYTDNPPEIIQSIEVFLSRDENYTELYSTNRDDLNAPYRLFDYPDQKTGTMKPGTISRINALKPELVVTLHLTHTESPASGAMATVITPGFQTYDLARQFVRASGTERRRVQQRFSKTPYAQWFISDDRYRLFNSFMADAFIYFIGYWSKPDGVHVDFTRYRGYRHNLLNWSYADSFESMLALNGKPNERYAHNLSEFEPLGSFWVREQSDPENWRRENGEEGFGGDNHYAGTEILRYTRQAFLVNGADSYKTLPKILRPYISTWAIPTYINAISAYLELAHTTSRRDYHRMAHERHIYAEAVAVGVYSLFYGLESKSSNQGKNFPKGKAVNWGRYENFSGSNYFKQVTAH